MQREAGHEPDAVKAIGTVPALPRSRIDAGMASSSGASGFGINVPVWRCCGRASDPDIWRTSEMPFAGIRRVAH